MKLGFTGTRKGMTDAQKNAVKFLLRSDSFESAHHGDCVGADADFHDLCGDAKINRVVHPPINESLRAWCIGEEYAEPKPYLQRNIDIVNSCDWLIACPKEMNRVGRGGTWHAVGYAQSIGKKVTIIWPNGLTSDIR